ncbi:MAG: hypothetical protein DHS20C10_09020 [marine bacterium B5-7]|nr:MAG: hypothetical protein DHS20C10_09020 [marine bacterium B5-7]
MNPRASSTQPKLLTKTGSLTQHLRAMAQDMCRVQCLEVEKDAHRWIKRTVIWVDEAPVIYAESDIPLIAMQGEGAALQQLETTALGDIFWTDPNLQRSPLDIFPLNAEDTLAQRAYEVTGKMPCWARRSVFTFFCHEISVTEVLLSSRT